MKSRIKIDKTALFIYMMLFFSGDTYLFGTNGNASVVAFARYLMIGFIIIMLIMMHLKIDLKNNKAKLIAYIIITISFILIAEINNELVNRVAIKLLCITVAFFLCTMVSFDKFVHAFIKAMVFISITTIVFSAVALAFPGIVKSLPYIVNTANTKVYTCGFAGLLDGEVGKILIRSQGIFWEPGVLQLYLNIAIAFELLYKNNYNRKNLIWLGLGLIITFSTTGFATFAWIIVCYSLKDDQTKNKLGRKVGVAFFFLVAFVVLYFTPIGELVFGKVLHAESSGTAMVRLAGVVTNIDIAKIYPLHGCGMENIDSEFLRLSMESPIVLGFTKQNTNTLLYQFAAHGLWYGGLFAVGTFLFGKCFNKKQVFFVTEIFIMFVMLYIGENLQYSILPYIVIFYGYGWREEILRSNECKEAYL